MKKILKKGDQLWYLSRHTPRPVLGTIVCFTDEPGKTIGLQFDDELPPHLGHIDLDGRGKKGFCVWAHPSQLISDQELKNLLDKRKEIYREFDELEI